MKRHPFFGLLFAAFGVLVLTPDTLFMRWSGMEGAGMMAWRGLLMGLAFIAIWVVLAKNRKSDIAMILGGAGLMIWSYRFNSVVSGASGKGPVTGAGS